MTAGLVLAVGAELCRWLKSETIRPPAMTPAVAGLRVKGVEKPTPVPAVASAPRKPAEPAMKPPASAKPSNRVIITEDTPQPQPAAKPVHVSDRPAKKGEGLIEEADQVTLGRELFARKWLPRDRRCHGGDGLGPVYNANSCLDCHSLGGPGGAGPASRNVELATGIGYSFCRTDSDRHKKIMGRCVATDLVRIHPGFQHARSIVLHRFGVDPGYSRWRASFVEQSGDPGLLIPDTIETFNAEVAKLRDVPQFGGARFPDRAIDIKEGAFGTKGWPSARDGRQVERVQFSITHRNPPPLFGAGQIDALPDDAFFEAAAQEPARVRGRVHRMKTGQLGRFGWKSQVASLQDFVVSACASELGLEAPGHHQADSPLDAVAMAEARVGARDALNAQLSTALAVITRGVRQDTPPVPFKPNGRALDLTQYECDALTAYIADLPAPVPVRPSGPRQSRAIEAGKRAFHSSGCAVCHAPNLGGIRDIYSDLLLHDMGPKLSDVGGYYNDSEDPDSPDSPIVSEWRTPPLWGVRDSGPYLHDGRAKTLQDAILQHGGQAVESAVRFRGLGTTARSDLLAFLNSLAAPASKVVDQESPAAKSERASKQCRGDANLASQAIARLHAAQVLETFGRTTEALERYRTIVRDAPDCRAGHAAAERIRMLDGE
jgi:CxxC motif-containing protein (DUF1111 family)